MIGYQRQNSVGRPYKNPQFILNLPRHPKPPPNPALIYSRNNPSIPIGKSGLPQELANSDDLSQSSKRLILTLYEALNSRHVTAIHKLVASDLEWWFHGPPAYQYLLRLLTGQDDQVYFDFIPQSVTAFGATVLVEGCDPVRRISWVHAWTVTDGIVTQVREYFNTSVTVTRFGNSNVTGSGSDSDSDSIRSIHCPSVWESSCSERVGKSVPGLVLAI